MNDKYVLCFRGINSKGKEEILKIYEASLSNIDKYTCYKGCYSSNDLYRLLPPEIKNYILTFKHNYDFEGNFFIRKSSKDISRGRTDLSILFKSDADIVYVKETDIYTSLLGMKKNNDDKEEIKTIKNKFFKELYEILLERESSLTEKIDAKRKDNKYPFNQLAGVGVVFKLIQAIGIKYNLEEKEYLKYLDLVCVGTISDIVPLVDENRVIAKLGLKLVEVTKNVGLKILLNAIGYKKIDSSAISFGVAPRINACGRMGHEKEALKLFLTENIVEATDISKKLNEYNKQRQDTEKKIFEEVLQKIENGEKNKPCIILADEKWHHGVIGIVASKVTEMYYKPSILICFEGDEGKGSGRSVAGFDLHDAVSKCDKYVDKFGGHSMAIGISVSKENFDKFKNDFEEYAETTNVKDLIPIIKVDDEIGMKDMQVAVAQELDKLEPFGEANKMPLFMYRNLKINSIRALSEGKHLKLTLKDDNLVIDAIGFNMGYLTEEFLLGDKIDVVGSLEINRFNGKCTN